MASINRSANGKGWIVRYRTVEGKRRSYTIAEATQVTGLSHSLLRKLIRLGYIAAVPIHRPIDRFPTP